MNQKLRDLEWNKDQEIKILQKNFAKLKEDGDQVKITSIQDIEKIKEEVSDRYKAEMSAKNMELLRLERMYTEKIDDLQKEVSKLHVQLDQ